MSDNSYLESVKELIWSTWDTKEIDYKDFIDIKQNLEYLYKETNDCECLWLISELYIHKINSYKKSANKCAIEAIYKDYDNSSYHDNYNISANGSVVDFSKRNHNSIIEYYYDFIKGNPSSLIARRILVENLIDNYRFDEAEIEIEKACKITEDKSYFFEFYAGEILYKKGYQQKAMCLWKEVCERNKGTYICYYLFAEQCANFARYDDALVYYDYCFKIQNQPRKIDSLISMFNIYEIKKDYPNMLKSVDLILSVYEEDYGITDGEEIIPYVIHKEKLDALVKQ